MGCFVPSGTCCEDHAMKIREIRSAKGVTQEDLAAALDVPQSAIPRAERLVEGTPIRTYIKIAEVLGVTLADLFSEDRAAEEQLLLAAFRRLPADRRQGWLDMATAIASSLP
jgi:transcriptional regulator with XRE-family HTH domain